MRLWHEDLLEKLPRQQLLGQHRECCALRGNGWMKAHSTVNYIFDYSPYKLYQYHLLVIEEMENRGYKPGQEWKDKDYRGKVSSPHENLEEVELESPIYPEHDDDYYIECIDNLKEKGIIIE